MIHVTYVPNCLSKVLLQDSYEYREKNVMTIFIHRLSSFALFAGKDHFIPNSLIFKVIAFKQKKKVSPSSLSYPAAKFFYNTSEVCSEDSMTAMAFNEEELYGTFFPEDMNQKRTRTIGWNLYLGYFFLSMCLVCTTVLYFRMADVPVNCTVACEIGKRIKKFFSDFFFGNNPEENA